jgi:hypothetical protein
MLLNFTLDALAGLRVAGLRAAGNQWQRHASDRKMGTLRTRTNALCRGSAGGNRLADGADTALTEMSAKYMTFCLFWL